MHPIRPLQGLVLLTWLAIAADVRGDDFPVEEGRPESSAPAVDEPTPTEPPADEPKRRRPKMLQAEPGEDVPEPAVRRRRRPAVGRMPQPPLPDLGAGPLDPLRLERTLTDIARQLARQRRGGFQAGGFGLGTRMQSSSTTTGPDGTTVRTLSESDGTTTVALEATAGDVTVTITGKDGQPLFDGAVVDPAAPGEVPPRFRKQVREMARQLGIGADPVDR